jgi:hypothetical protein
VEWNEQIRLGRTGMDDYLSAIDDISKESYVDNALRLCWRVMVAIRRFIWPEYITIVLKLSLLDGVFNTQEHVWDN